MQDAKNAILKVLRPELLEKYHRGLQEAQAEALATPRGLFHPPGHPPKPLNPPLTQASPPPVASPGLLLAQAEQGGLEPYHPLECPEEEDPRWQAAKRIAVNRIKHFSPQLPFTTHNPKHGPRSGPAAFVALFLSLMIFYRDSRAERRFSIFATQWAIADILGVSTDTIQRWQQDLEVSKWLHSWRWLDPSADHKRAGMFYTILYNPTHPHKKPRGDLLKLRHRCLAQAIVAGQTRRQVRGEGREQEGQQRAKSREQRAKEQESQALMPSALHEQSQLGNGSLPSALCSLPAERLHISGTLKARWQQLMPLNKKALGQYGFKDVVSYVAALNPWAPQRSQRLEWARELVEALERHLGVGDDPETRRKLYWKIALTCLRALVYSTDKEIGGTPILMLRRALVLTSAANGKFKLRNPGAFLCKELRKQGFFEVAGLYQGRGVA